MDRYSTEVQEYNSTNPEAASVIASAMEQETARPSLSFWARSDELLAQDITGVPMLVDGLFLRTGLAGIVGASDTGKSMFARQLAIDIATGAESFLNYRLRLQHGSAIYVASEDSRDATAYLLKKQWRGPANGNVRCLFADECDERISPLIADSLSHERADLVVIDTWGDLFAFDAKPGASNNDETPVRRLLAEYKRLATEFGCLIHFVAHTRKGGSKEAPHRDHTSGSGALERKLRCQLHLASVPARAIEGLCPDLKGVDLRALTITKANYLPKDRKDVISLLQWDGNGFRFEDTKRTTKLDIFGEYLSDNAPKKKEDENSELPALPPGEYKRQELADRAGVPSGSGTFGRMISKALKAGQIQPGKRGVYIVPESEQPPQPPENSPDELW
jgi:RecA-family ATPase